MDEFGVPLRRVRVRRSIAEKRRTVEQTLEHGASVARVAQAHGVNPNVVFQWRREYRDGKLVEPGLVPVVVTCDQAVRDVSRGDTPATIRFSSKMGFHKAGTGICGLYISDKRTDL